MQYLLTKEELDALHAQINEKARMPTQKALQEFCTHVAETEVLTTGWRKGHVWGCILNAKTSMQYCDDCPAKKICPHPHKSHSQ